MESNPVLALDSEVCKDSLGTFVWSISKNYNDSETFSKRTLSNTLKRLKKVK